MSKTVKEIKVKYSPKDLMLPRFGRYPLFYNKITQPMNTNAEAVYTPLMLFKLDFHFHYRLLAVDWIKDDLKDDLIKDKRP